MSLLIILTRFTSGTSVLMSFLAGMHQLYLGYLHQGAGGFSVILLMAWLLGDVCNVIGTFWTHQLLFQRIIACASTFTDVLLFTQHLYYERKARDGYGDAVANPDIVDGVPPDVGQRLRVQWNALLRPYILFTLVSASRAASIVSVLDLDEEASDWEFLVGQCFAWVAELSYAFALVPQVMINLARKSTGSVSVGMFVADAIGSMNYLATIFITADEKSTRNDVAEFLFEELPYIVGTALCLLLDCVLLLQYFVYPQFVVVEENVGLNFDPYSTALLPAQSKSSFGILTPTASARTERPHHNCADHLQQQQRCDYERHLQPMPQEARQAQFEQSHRPDGPSLPQQQPHPRRTSAYDGTESYGSCRDT